jgi:hypothetical protein
VYVAVHNLVPFKAWGWTYIFTTANRPTTTFYSLTVEKSTVIFPSAPPTSVTAVTPRTGTRERVTQFAATAPPRHARSHPQLRLKHKSCHARLHPTRPKSILRNPRATFHSRSTPNRHRTPTPTQYSLYTKRADQTATGTLPRCRRIPERSEDSLHPRDLNPNPTPQSLRFPIGGYLNHPSRVICGNLWYYPHPHPLISTYPQSLWRPCTC